MLDPEGKDGTVAKPTYEDAVADLKTVDNRLQELSTLRQQIDAEIQDLVGRRNYLAGVADALAPEDTLSSLDDIPVTANEE